jgi:hypothetical protein
MTKNMNVGLFKTPSNKITALWKKPATITIQQTVSFMVDFIHSTK